MHGLYPNHDRSPRRGHGAPRPHSGARGPAAGTRGGADEDGHGGERMRLKVGVIGCGLIAQVMHLHYLRELAEQFEIAALCDVSDTVREACARDYGVRRTCADSRDLIAMDIDAVLVLTSGSHAPIAIAAADAGKHVLV